jgi:hypothetical protein
MQCVFSAERAVLVQFETVGIVLFVLHGVVISLLALGAAQSDLDSCTSLCHCESAPPFNLAARKADRFIEPEQKQKSWTRLT